MAFLPPQSAIVAPSQRPPFLSPHSSLPLACSSELHIYLSKRKTFTNGLLALLGSSTIQCLYCDAANAFSFGISGPKDWLKAQKKKSANFLLAPISASRERLNSAQNIISNSTSLGDFQEAQKSVTVAARDCIPPESDSLVAFQAKTGVEVCTFRLILRNAASLLDDRDPTKLKADAALNNLISAFISLDQLLSSAIVGTFSNREDVAGAFNQTQSALNTFESGIRDCLGIA